MTKRIIILIIALIILTLLGFFSYSKYQRIDKNIKRAEHFTLNELECYESSPITTSDLKGFDYIILVKIDIDCSLCYKSYPIEELQLMKAKLIYVTDSNKEDIEEFGNRKNGIKNICQINAHSPLLKLEGSSVGVYSVDGSRIKFFDSLVDLKTLEKFLTEI
jgi:hypothetical protein